MSAKSVEVGQWGAHCPCLDDPPRPSPMLLYPVGFRAHTHLPPAHDYLLLQVHSAKHLAPARLNGSSDPFCVVVVDNETARTKPQKGACLPACLPACPGLASLFVACPPTLPLPLPVIPPPLCLPLQASWTLSGMRPSHSAVRPSCVRTSCSSLGHGALMTWQMISWGR